MQPSNSNHVVKTIGSHADDFFFTILLLKQTDFQNDAIPFLHSHTLELAVKAASIKLNINLDSFFKGHDIIGLYRNLAKTLTELQSIIPTENHMQEYKKVFLPSDNLNRNIVLPNPEQLDELELAYFMDNSMDLKYGFNKGYVQPSVLSFSGPDINRKFFKVFKICRDAYTEPLFDTKLKSKITYAFRNELDLENKFFKPLSI